MNSSLPVFRTLDLRLFTIGDTPVTVSSLLLFVLALLLLFWLSGWLRTLLLRRILVRSQLDLGTQQAIGSIVRYAVLVIGLVIVLQTAGINLAALTLVGGAFGVGIGFGLQHIFSNFISGLIIMFERPIKVGDRIELANIEGTVQAIGARRTTVLTNDNIAVIVPNQRFITDNVVNLLYAGRQVRVHVPVSVLHGPDPRLVERLLLEAASAHPDVLAEPRPSVRLLSLGGGAAAFELLVWTSTRIATRRQLLSELNFAISERLRSREIRTG